MIRAVLIVRKLPDKVADALDHQSGRIYTEGIIDHYRIYRNHTIWLNNPKTQKHHDRISQSSFLYAHSMDATQDVFYKVSPRCCQVMDPALPHDPCSLFGMEHVAHEDSREAMPLLWYGNVT